MYSNLIYTCLILLIDSYLREIICALWTSLIALYRSLILKGNLFSKNVSVLRLRCSGRLLHGAVQVAAIHITVMILVIVIDRRLLRISWHSSTSWAWVVDSSCITSINLLNLPLIVDHVGLIDVLVSSCKNSCSPILEIRLILMRQDQRRLIIDSWELRSVINIWQFEVFLLFVVPLSLVLHPVLIVKSILGLDSLIFSRIRRTSFVSFPDRC